MAIGKSDSVHYQNIADSIRRNLSGAEGGDAVYFPAEMAGGVNAVAEHNYQKGYTDGGGGAVSNGERFIKTVYGIEKNVSVNEAVDQAILDFNAIKFELGNRGAVVSDIEPTENYSGKIVEVYDKGAEAGYSSGKEAGITEGFETGKQAGIAEGYNTGKAEGYNSGYQIGKVDGKNEGYTEGVESGKAEAEAEVKPMMLKWIDNLNALIVRPVNENSSIEDISYELDDACERSGLLAMTHVALKALDVDTAYSNPLAKRIKARDETFIIGDISLPNPYLLELPKGMIPGRYASISILEVFDASGNVTNDDFINDMQGVNVYNLYSPNSGETKIRTDEDGWVWYVSDTECYLCDYIGKERNISLPTNYEGRDYELWYAALDGLKIDSIRVPEDFNKNFKISSTNRFGNDIDIIIGDISEWFEKKIRDMGSLFFWGTCYINCGGERITDIVVPAGITSIGDYQLAQYSNMKSIVFHDNVTSIGKYAFGYCSGLTEIVLPTNLTSIGGYTFYMCSSLQRIVHNGNTLAQAMCYYCEALTDIIINGNVTTVSGGAFSGCKNITNVTVNGSIKISNSSLSFNASTKLTVESMVSIMNGLVSNVGGTQYTVYFGSTNLNKLTAEQKAIATNKNIKLA